MEHKRRVVILRRNDKRHVNVVSERKLPWIIERV